MRLNPKMVLLSGTLALSLFEKSPALAGPASQVWVMNEYVDSANEPLDRLANALQGDKKSRFFRLAWGIGLTSNYEAGATALYDRKLHLLKYYSSENYRTNKDEDEVPVKWGHAAECIWYRHVTDRILFKLSAKHRNADSSDVDAFFNELPRYGCHKRRIFSWFHSETLKG